MIISIILEDGTRRQVDADVEDGLAIHPDIYVGYSITHVLSGGRVGKAKTMAGAKRFREILLSIRVGGLSLGQLPGCEICANALALHHEIVERLPFQSDHLVHDEHHVLRVVERAADVFGCNGPKSVTLSPAVDCFACGATIEGDDYCEDDDGHKYHPDCCPLCRETEAAIRLAEFDVPAD